MKITANTLRQLVREEIKRSLKEANGRAVRDSGKSVRTDLSQVELTLYFPGTDEEVDATVVVDTSGGPTEVPSIVRAFETATGRELHIDPQMEPRVLEDVMDSLQADAERRQEDAESEGYGSRRSRRF